LEVAVKFGERNDDVGFRVQGLRLLLKLWSCFVDIFWSVILAGFGIGLLSMNNAEEEALSAGAYYSQDFEWEALRDEVERMPGFLEEKRRASPASLRTVEEDPPSTSTSWEAFHTRHSRNLFFKERRYLTKEFPDLCKGDKPLFLLEVGCGTGSSVVPVMRANKQATVYACDCSAAALRKASEVVDSASDPSSTSVFIPFLHDIAISKLPDFLCCSACRRKNRQSEDIGTESHEQLEPRSLPGRACCIGGLDIVTIIFTLSAIPVEKMAHVLLQCLEVLKPGGLLLFRDYGLYDMTMLRFAPRQRISRCLYQREDGTLSYFFSLEVVRALFTEAGFVERELEYCCVQLMNRRKQVPMKRVWVHAKFQKPDQT
jgi:methyltransferase-like protein 6